MLKYCRYVFFAMSVPSSTSADLLLTGVGSGHLY